MQAVGTSRFSDAECRLCGAGRTIAFAWRVDKATARELRFPPHSTFVSPEPLRRGKLLYCKLCNGPWHLDQDEAFLSTVPPDRLALIRDWSRRPITLADDLAKQVAAIGPTPPDAYGNGREYTQTPCGVVTTTGERIEIAMVSGQSHAPFEGHRRCRLGTEIAEVFPSPFALSLDVRVASARAQERRMGFAPTLVVAPDGVLFTLNWTTHFFVRPGRNAPEMRLAVSREPNGDAPIVPDPPDITYFIVDR